MITCPSHRMYCSLIKHVRRVSACLRTSVDRSLKDNAIIALYLSTSNVYLEINTFLAKAIFAIKCHRFVANSRLNVAKTYPRPKLISSSGLKQSGVCSCRQITHMRLLAEQFNYASSSLFKNVAYHRHFVWSHSKKKKKKTRTTFLINPMKTSKTDSFTSADRQYTLNGRRRCTTKRTVVCHEKKEKMV